MKSAILITFLLFTGCIFNSSKIETLETNMKEQKIIIETPINRLNVETTSACMVYVNDILIAQNNSDSLGIFDIINDIIRSSGKQTIKVVFTQKAELNKLELYKSDSIDSDKYELIDIYDKNLDSNIVSWEVDVTVPYNNEGWSNSNNLLLVNQDLLLDSVVDFYQNLNHLINDGDYQAYNVLFEKANKEINNSLFLTEANVLEESQIIKERILDSKDKTTLNSDFHLSIYANGRIVSLEDSLGNPFIVSNRAGGNSYWGFYPHRPKGSKDLEII